MRTQITVTQRINEHSGNVFIRAAKTVRIGQVLRIVPSDGSADKSWLKIDARKNNGSAWKSYLKSPEKSDIQAMDATEKFLGSCK